MMAGACCRQRSSLCLESLNRGARALEVEGDSDEKDVVLDGAEEAMSHVL